MGFGSMLTPECLYVSPGFVVRCPVATGEPSTTCSVAFDGSGIMQYHSRDLWYGHTLAHAPSPPRAPGRSLPEAGRAAAASSASEATSCRYSADPTMLASMVCSAFS